MVFVSRKVLYPSFIVVFSIVFFTLVFFFYFSSGLVADNSSVEIDGDSVVFKTTITNVSNHIIRNIRVELLQEDVDKSVKVGDLRPDENVDVIIDKIPFTNDLYYEVKIDAFLNRPVNLFFTLDESNVRPVDTNVMLAKDMRVGESYDYSVKLCNISNNALIDVFWSESAIGNYFDEVFVPRTIDLGIGECKNLNSTLTPIRPGNVEINFNLRVGKLEQNLEYEIVVVE